MSTVVLRVVGLLVCAGLLQACGDTRILTTNDIDPDGHLSRHDYTALRHREQYADQAPTVPPIPQNNRDVTPPVQTIPGGNKLVSVTVTDTVPLRDVLIELAREAKVNLELDPRIQGGIIFSAHEQPFSDVLKHICDLAGLRTVTEGKFVRIELDDPYQQTYQLDYLSLARKTTSETSIATNVFDVNVTNTNGINGSNGGGAGNSNGASSSENNSTSKVSGASDADFWGEVDKSLTQILSNAVKADKEKIAPSFSIDKQEGMVTVFGNSVQQAAIESYVQKLKRKAYSQVLIDARIIEVELNDSFKSGINWSTLFSRGLNVGANFTPAAISPTNSFAASVNVSDFSGLLELVQGFGTTRVLSSPRLTVLNNQTAVLKVATNQVYFVTQAQFTTVTNANGSAVTTTPVYTSTPHTVPVGLVMTVQPSIDSDHNRVTMTLRPTISRVVSEVDDPSIGLNAALAGVTGAAVQSQIPVLAVREMDSVIQLHSGEVAVMGGLMQDNSTNNDQGIPGLDTLPVAGNLFKSRDNEGTTTELVILLRATISDNPQPDNADDALYHRYNNDPRPMPMPEHISSTPPLPPLPELPANPS